MCLLSQFRYACRQHAMNIKGLMTYLLTIYPTVYSQVCSGV